MTAPRYQADLPRVMDLLCAWIHRKSSNEEVDWLRARQAQIEEGAPDWKLFTAFSGVPRYLNKDDLELSDSDLDDASRLRKGWTPRAWSVDQAARTVLLLSFPSEDRDRFVKTIDQIYSTADARESVALYQVLPLFPYPEAFISRAAEGLRTNMTSVFNAVAHDNPFPREFLDEAAWNQMVLKALFVGSPLFRIQGLDERANSELARMLVDYAHERRAAGRSVSPELWRPVGPFAGDAYLDDLRLVLSSEDDVEREAAVLALSQADSEAAAAMLERHPDLVELVEAGELTWDAFSRNRIPVPA